LMSYITSDNATDIDLPQGKLLDELKIVYESLVYIMITHFILTSSNNVRLQRYITKIYFYLQQHYTPNLYKLKLLKTNF
jgi:hypothetical protein